MTKQTTMTKDGLTLPPAKITSDLQVVNYDTLLNYAKAIENKYKGFVGNQKQCRSIKRKLNGLNRQLNDLRKVKAKPYRQQLKAFKAKIDTLRSHIGNVTTEMTKQLKIYKKRDQQERLDKYRPIWQEMTAPLGIKDAPVPQDILKKKSLSKHKILMILHNSAQLEKRRLLMEQAHVVHGKPVALNTVTGEINPLPKTIEARHLTFIGSQLDLMSLINLAKKNGFKFSVK